jgi:ABC-2 type transport system permease protein
MNIHRILTITRRIFRGLRNDWRALVMMFVTPVIGIAVFGVAFSGDVNSVDLVVVNQDQGYQIPPSSVPVSIADAVVANFDTHVLKLDRVATEEEAVDRVRRGKAFGLIIFPENFTSNVYEKMMDPSLALDTTIRLELDRSNVTVANSILKAVSDAMLKASSAMGVEAPVSLDSSTAIYAQEASFRDFSVPGITAFVVFMLTFILTLLAFVSERTSGSLERLQVTPLRESELVIGYALAFSIIAVLQTAMVLAVIVGVFKVMVVGNILLAFLVIALLAVMSLSLGIMLSSLAKREAQAIQFLPLVALPVFLLGGVFWPVEGIPAWMRPLSYAIPPSYAVNATRSVMLRGWGVGDIWVELVALVGFTVAFLALSVWSLHRARG